LKTRIPRQLIIPVGSTYWLRSSSNPPEIEEERYSWSLDGESFQGSYSTREEARSQGVWTGRQTKIEIQDLMRDCDVLEHLEKRAIERVGSEAEGWLTKNVDALKARDFDRRLERFLQNWLREQRLTPQFYSITEVEYIDD